MKRLLITLAITLSVLAIIVISFFALLVNDAPVSPSCTSSGLGSGKHLALLSITVSKQEEIPALGHDLIYHEGKEPMCTEPGYEPYETCSRCDYSTFKEIPALGHDIINYGGKAATCTESGYEPYDACTRCNYTTFSEIHALGHNLIHHNGLEPTCLLSGYEPYCTCSQCEYTTFTEIPALGHDIIYHEGKDATCTEDGFAPYSTCSRCRYSTYTVIKKLGHHFSSFSCERCNLDYAVYTKVGKTSTAKVSNDNVGYSFYKSQNDTGVLSNSNCGPTCAYMVCKWVDEDFSVSVENIRKISPKPSEIDYGWFPENVEAAIVHFLWKKVDTQLYTINSKSDSYDSTAICDIMKYIDDGNLLVICFNLANISSNSSWESVLGLAYNQSKNGHFVVIKGYWIVNEIVYFEVYDPAINSWYNNQYLGNNRTRYFDAMELVNSAFNWNPKVVTVAKRAS